MSQAWMKFYPSDWRADPALRMCSLAARGLWMEMLCLMHEAEEYGSLLINDKQVTEKQLASLCGVPVREVKSHIKELESAGVFSRDALHGTVYSRRMKRDHEKALRDKANGKGGGNPGLKGGVNPPVNGEDKAQIPEAREPERKEDTADAVSSKIIFEAGIIRLTQKHFDQWKQAFSYLDLAAELISLQEWAGGQGSRWFPAVSGALAKRNREVKAARDQPQSDANKQYWGNRIPGIS